VQKLADFALKILDSTDLQHKLGKNAREFANKFDPDMLTDKLESIYISLLNKKSLTNKNSPKLRLT